MSVKFHTGDRLIYPEVREQELVSVLMGERLGQGISREVFECPLRPDLVVKREREAGRFQNVKEWEVWQHVQYTDFARWFAPCEGISPCGTILFQKRTTPARAEELPDQVPAFLSDCKVDNWGRYDGGFVMHDYGYNLVTTRGMSKRMRWVNWT
ncbi:MAG: hypothetical protein JKY94_17665 [Rhodobacteraceae bacterium]|nr:hypothetical protein [Paracoccaceae bacterium]